MVASSVLILVLDTVLTRLLLESMIELRNVHKAFGKQVVLNGVDFEVREGETVALLGPSGTGKSVLLKHIIGLIQPDQGTIIVDGKDVGRLKRKELSELRSHIGYVFQNGALFDSMNVFENVRLGITDEDQLRRPGVLPSARRRVHPAGESAARNHRKVSRPSCRAACGSGSASPGPSPAIPSICSTTSPPPASIRSTPTSSTAWSSGSTMSSASPASW